MPTIYTKLEGDNKSLDKAIKDTKASLESLSKSTESAGEAVAGLTERSAQAAEQINKENTQVTETSKAIGDISSVAQQAAQSLTAVPEELRATVQASTSLEGIEKRFEKITESSAPVTKKLADIKRAMLAMSASGLDASAEGAEMWNKLAEAAQTYKEQIDKVSDAISGSEEMTAPTLETISEKFEGITISADPLTPKITEIRKTLEEMAASGLDTSEEGQKMWNELVEKSKHYREQIDKVSAAMKQTNEVIEEVKKPAQSIDEVRKKFAEIKESASPLNTKISEIRKTLEEMAVAGLNTSQEGREMWADLCEAAKEYEGVLKDIKKESSNLDKDIELPDLSFKRIGNDIAKHFGLDKAAEAATATIKAINPVITGAAVAIGGTMIADGKATNDFETHLDYLQALKKTTYEEIAKMSDTSLTLSKKFGMSASDIVDAMGLIGSQAPILLENTDALAAVTDASMTLSKAGSIAADQAAAAITAVTNQMGVSADEAMNIANALEAAEQKGAGSVDFLNKAISKSGVMAAKAGLSYVELISLIESAAPKFQGKAEEAGTAMQGIFLSLANAKDEFNPAVVGMTKALENLNDAHLSQSEMTQLVGQSGTKMLQVLINEREEYARMQTEIDGTNAAVDAWQMKSDNMAGMVDRLKSTWDAFLIMLGQSGVIEGICDHIESLMSFLMDVIDVISEIVDAFRGFGDGAVEDVTSLIHPLGSVKEQIQMLGVIIKALGEVIAVVVRLIGKALETVKNTATDAADYIGEKWEALKKALGDVAFARFIISAFDSIMKKVGSVISQIKQWWNDLKKSLGMEVSVESSNKGLTPAQRKAQEEEAKKQIAEDTKKRNEEAAARAKAEKEAKAKKGKKSSKTEKIDYLVSIDDSSLDMAEKKLQAWTAKKKTLKIDDVEGLKECDEQVKKWTEEVKTRKVALGIEVKVEEGSVTDIEENIKKLEEKKKKFINTKVNSSVIKEIDSEIKELKVKLEAEQMRVGVIPFVSPDSVNGIQKQIKELEKELDLLLNVESDPEDVKKIVDKLDALRKQEKSKRIEIGVDVQEPTIKIPEQEKFQRGSKEDKKQSIQNAQSRVETIKEEYKLQLINKDEVKSQIEEIDSLLQSLDLKPLNLTINDDGTITTAMEDLEKYKERMQSTADIVSNVGNVFGSLGSSIGGTTGEVMNFAGQSLNAISQIIPQVVSLIAAKQAEAMASGTASAAAMPFPANIAAMTSIIATIAGLFASLPKFENGGIIGGSSFVGDKILARVNSGEMILNKKQQGSLYSALSDAGAGGGNGMQNVEFTLRGDVLKGAIKNYDKRISRLK